MSSDDEYTPLEELAARTLTYREARQALARTTLEDYLYVFMVIVLAVTDLMILHIPPQLIVQYILKIPVVLPKVVVEAGPAMTYLFLFWTLGAYAIYFILRDKVLPPLFYLLDGFITGISSLIAFFYTGVPTLLVFTGMALFELAMLHASYFSTRERLKDAIYDAYIYGVRTPFTEDELRLIGFTDEELEELLGRREKIESKKEEVVYEEGEEG
jgi:hypothetical protein